MAENTIADRTLVVDRALFYAPHNTVRNTQISAVGRGCVAKNYRYQDERGAR